MNGKAHLLEALRWSTEAEVAWVDVLVAGLGMAAPVLLASAAGRLPLGLAASIGGLIVSGVGVASSTRAQIKALAWVLVPAILASLAAAIAARHGWVTDASVIALACAAAIVSGYSRQGVVATTRFILFLVIITEAANAASSPAGLLFLIAAGALWTSLLSLLFGAAVRASRRTEPSGTVEVSSSATATQKFRRWRKSLSQLSGWQYPLRLALCTAIAWLCRSMWPAHHFYWITLTAVILLRRPIEALPLKATQRAIGTAFGVLAASLFLAWQPSGWGLALGIALLAAVRPVLKARHYLGYSMIMAPLVMLILGSGEPVTAGILVDRLVATLLGVGIVLAVNQGFIRVTDH